MKIENTFPAESADTQLPLYTILLVDDSAANLGVLVESLESHGYDVPVALDGNEALERIEVNVPDLILLDVMMPGMDGFEVCRRLKAQDSTRDIPVIFMTSLGSTIDKVNGFAAGGVDYIIKPLHLEETLARIRTHLELGELRRKLEAQNRALQQEVVERKQMETILIRSEREYRTLSENSPDNIIRYDRDCRIRYINKNFEAALGLPAAFMLGKTSFEVFSDGLFDELESVLKQVVESGQPADYYITLPDSGEGERYHHLRITPERDERGEVNGILTIGRDITERKRMEDALAAREREFRTLAENFPDVVIRYNLDGRRTYVNRALAELAGAAPDEMLGKFLEDTPLVDPETYVAELRKVIATRDASVLEVAAREANGEISWFQARFVPEFDAGNNVSSVLMVASNITERRRMEQELLRRETGFRTLAENLPVAVIRYDAEQRRRYINPAAERMLHGNMAELLGNVPGDGGVPATPETIAFYRSKMDEVLKSGEVRELEFVLDALPEEKQEYYEVRFTPESGADGKPGGVLSIWFDITGRKRMENEIRQQANFRQTLLDAINEVGLQLMMIEDGRINYVSNLKLAREFGYSDEEIAAGVPMMDIVHPDDRARVMDYHVRRADGEALPNSYELSLVTKSGERREYETSVSVVPGTSPIRIISVGKDITERKRMESAFHDSERMLQDAQRIAHVGSWDVDMVNDKLVWSDEIFRIWEIDKTKFKADFAAFLATVHPEDQGRVTQAYNDAVVNHSLYEVEHRLLFPDGRVKHILERGEPQYDAQGKPVRFIGTSLDITERKQMEEALVAREQQFRALAENTPDPIYRYDRDCRRIYVNQAVSRMSGKSAEELLGGLPSDGAILISEQNKNLMAKIRRVFDSGEAERLDIDYTSRTGEHCDYQMMLVPERDDSGAVMTVLGIARDVTEIRSAERRLSQFVANVPGYVYTYKLNADYSGSYPFVSPGVADVLGLQPEEVAMDAAPMMALIHPDDIARLGEVAGESMRTMQPYSLELRITHPTKGARWLESHASPELTAEGLIQWHGMTLDITERKLAQQQQELLDTAISHSSDAIYLVGNNQRFHYVNAAACRHLDYSREELLGMGILDIDPLITREMLLEGAALLETGAKLPSMESLHRARDGRELPVEVSTSLIEHNGEQFMLSVVRDITERKFAEQYEQFRSHTLELLASNQSLPGILEEIVRGVEQLNPKMLCSILLLDTQGKHLVDGVAPSLPDFYNEAIGGVEIGVGVGSCGTCAATGERVIVEDIQTHPYWAPFKELAAQAGLGACWSQPVRSSSGEVLGTFAIYHRAAHSPTALDISLIEKVAHIASIAIERKRMEAALAVREQEFHALVEHAPEPIFRYAPDGRRIYVNAAVECLTGIPASVLLGEPSSDGKVISTQAGAALTALVMRIFATGEPGEIEVENVGADGCLRHFHNRLAPEFDADGKVRSVFSISHDITERKKMEVALQASERDFRSLAENLPDNIARWDTAGRYLYINPAHECTLGVAASEVIGKPLPATHEHVRAAIAQVVASGRAVELVRQTVPVGDELQTHEVTLVPEFDAAGHVVSVLGLGRNMTEFYRMQDTIAAREQQLRLLADSSPGMMGAFYSRPDGSLCMPYVSPNINELFGLQPQDVVIDASPLLAMNHPDDAQRVAESIAESARSMTTWHEEYRIIHPVRGERWMESNTNPMPHPEGGVVWYGYVHDITERKRMEGALKFVAQGGWLSGEAFLHALVRYLGETLGVEYVVIDRFSADQMYAETLSIYAKGEIVPNMQYGLHGTPCGIVMSGTESSYPDDVQGLFPDAGVLAAMQARSYVGLPLRDVEGRVIGLIAALDGQAMTDTNSVMLMLQRVAASAAAELVRSRMEGSMRESHESLTEAQRIARVGNWELNLVSGALTWSDEIYRIFEIDQVQFGASYEAFLNAIHPADREAVNRAYSESLENRLPYEVEHRLLFADGRIKYVQEHCETYFSGDGKPLRSVGTVQDISARKQAEEALQRSEQLMRTVIDATPDWIFIKDQEHRYRLVNQGYANALHLAPEDFIGKNDLDLGFPEELVKGNPEKGIRGFWADDRLVMDSNETHVYSDDPATIDGVVHTFHTIKVPLRDANEKPWGVLAFARDITERKLLESELLESRNFLNKIIDSIPDPIFVKDKEHRWVLGNEAFCKLLGHPREKLIGKSDYDFLPKEQADVFWGKDELVFNSGETNVNEEAITGGDGDMRYLHTKKTPFVGADGQALLVAVIRDITERKQAEEAARASGEKLSELFKLSPLGIALTDMQGRYVEFNEAFRAICGYPADELMTLDYWTLTPKEYEAHEGEQLESLSKTGRYGPYEKEYRQKDGTRIPIQLNGTLIRGKDGQNYIWSIVENISERKRAEAQLKEKFERIIELNDQLEINARDLEDQAVEFEAQAVELEASQAQIKMTEAWYRGIVRSAPEGMVVVNDAGCISLVNAHLEKMFGYEEGELLGHSIEVLLPSDIRQGHVTQRDRFFAAGVTGRPTDAMVGSLRACRKDGSEFPVEVSLSRLPEIDGRSGSICASVRDITGRLAMESARETALAEALRLAQLRSTFMAQMSHELRTPLNGILGYAQNLLQGDALGEKQTAGLRIIQNSGEHLLSLINGILDHAAIEADKFELIPGDIELEVFLSTIIGIVRVRAEQKNLAFTCAADAELPAVVRGDAQRLRQVLLNLLANAVKFTDSGQVTLRVNYLAPSRLHFAVQDSGVGIDADQLETIFLPFEQAGETSRRAGGSGLGLAISRKLVRLMGGDIKAESQPGAGSVFSFEIDMATVQSGMAKVNVAALSEQATTRVAQAIWLHAPSPQELDILHGSALRGNMRDVIKHADQLAGADSRYLPFAEQVRQLARGFQTKALLSLIAQYRNEKEAEQ